MREFCIFHGHFFGDQQKYRISGNSRVGKRGLTEKLNNRLKLSFELLDFCDVLKVVLGFESFFRV